MNKNTLIFLKKLEEVKNRQKKKGLEKYKTTLEEAGLSKKQLTEHVLEELYDCTEYFIQLNRLTKNKMYLKKSKEIIDLFQQVCDL